MPRISRAATGSNVLHVINRGNARATVFRSEGDYAGCINLLTRALERFRLDLYAFALMPNHFHLVVHPSSTPQLSEFMQWWLTALVRRQHSARKTSGHIWQGRFKSFPVQHDEHLLTVLRYVLRNPVRAGLVDAPTDWPWSSLRYPRLVTPWPVQPPGLLESWMADPLQQKELEQVRHCIARKAPFGDPQWQRSVSEDAGLQPSLRPLGRPKQAWAGRSPAAGGAEHLERADSLGET